MIKSLIAIVLILGLTNCSLSRNLACQIRYDKEQEADRTLCQIKPEDRKQKALEILGKSVGSVSLFYEKTGNGEVFQKDAASKYNQYRKNKTDLAKSYRILNELREAASGYKNLQDKKINDIIEASYYNYEIRKYSKLLKDELEMYDLANVQTYVEYINLNPEIISIRKEINASIKLADKYIKEIASSGLRIEKAILQKRGIPKKINCFGKGAISHILMVNKLPEISGNCFYAAGPLQILQVSKKGVLAKLPALYMSPYSSNELIFIYTNTSNLIDGRILDGIYLYPTKPYSFTSPSGVRTIAAFKEVDVKGLFFIFD